MHNLITKALFAVFLSQALPSSSIMAADNDLEDWEKNFRHAAQSYEMPYEDFLAEAKEFLTTYNEKHPLERTISLKDVIVIEKPDPNLFNEKLAEFKKLYPGTDIEPLLNLNVQPSIKFTIAQ